MQYFKKVVQLFIAFLLLVITTSITWLILTFDSYFAVFNLEILESTSIRSNSGSACNYSIENNIANDGPQLLNLDQFNLKFWHEIEIPSGRNSPKMIYVHAFYFDNRPKLKGKPRILSFVSSKANIDQEKNLFCYIWTRTGMKDDSGKSFYNFTKVMAKSRNVEVILERFRKTRQNIPHMPFLLSCELDKNTSKSFDTVLPEYVTLKYISDENAISVGNIDNLIEIIIPEKPLTSANVSKDIGICCHGLYGEIKKKDVPYIVQWVETALMFGVKEITIYNITSYSTTEYFSKLVNYFSTTRGVFNFNQFAPLPPYLNLSTEKEHKTASELLVRHTSGDCLLRNMYKYHYTLYIDIDEIVVPRFFKSYQDFLENYGNRTSNVSSLHSIAVRSALFLMQDKHFADESVSKDFPILRFHTRTKAESVEKCPGHSKSFINPLLCDVLWQHRCFNESFEYVDEKEILIHHYRDSCPRKDECGAVCGQKGRWKRKDPFLLQHYKSEVTQRTQSALNAIGWT